MIMFLLTIAFLTAFFAGLFSLVKKNVVSIYRGGVFIILSGLYFSAVFAIAHLMRESFK
jgi:hypothetical protein